MTRNNNNIPPYAEEVVIEQTSEQKIIQGILNRFKQPIPDNFIKLKVEEGNYICSTNPK
jgi:hypothetical protein